MSIFGNPVMIGGSGGGGGGGDVPLLTRAAWNELTTAQKQSYGLVAVQDANSGFDRGELVYGAGFVPFIRLLEVCQTAYGSGPTTYTADRVMRVLAINTNTHRNTDSSACTAVITTTGTVVATDTQTSTTSAESSVTAGQMTFSIIDLTVGDTITMSNNTVSETEQIHLLIETDISSLTNVYWDIWPDQKSGNSFTKVLDSTKKYLVVVLQISKNTQSQTISANIAPVDLSITYGGADTRNYAYMGALVENAANVTIQTGNVNNFVGSAYAVYEVTT